MIYFMYWNPKGIFNIYDKEIFHTTLYISSLQYQSSWLNSHMDFRKNIYIFTTRTDNSRLNVYWIRKWSEISTSDLSFMTNSYKFELNQELFIAHISVMHFNTYLLYINGSTSRRIADRKWIEQRKIKWKIWFLNGVLLLNFVHFRLAHI